MPLLDDVQVVRADDEAVIGFLAGQHVAAVATEQRHREHPGLPGGAQPGSDVAAPAIARQPERDVVRSAEHLDLMGIDTVKATARRYSHQRGRVAHQGQGRQRTLADDHRVHELHRDMLCIGGPRPVAEDEQAAASLEAPGHVPAGKGQRGRVAGQSQHRCHPPLERLGDDSLQGGAHDRHNGLLDLSW